MNIRRIILVLSLVFGVVVTAMIWHVSQLQSRLTNSTALRTAELYSVALMQFRSLYTSEVVAKAGKHGLDAAHDYASRDNAIPLPATLSMMLGENIGRHASGAHSYLYSPYPFPWRKQANKAQLKEFGKDAWDFLSANPDQPYYRFERRGEKTILRYATADVMGPECITCHNSHPDSSKRDWQVGDVRGVLEITLPLDDITAQTTSDLKKTSIAYSVAGFGIAAIIGFVIIKLLQRSQELKRRVARRTAELRSEVTRRRAAIDALTETEERGRLLLNSAGEGIFGLDLEGKTTFVNPAVCRLLGYEQTELLGQPIHALIHHSRPDGSSYPAEDCPMLATITDGYVRRPTDEVLWRKDNSSVPVEYTSTPIRRDGELVGAVVVVTDITERKKMEERFRLGIEASPAAMIMVDESGVILHVNQQVEYLFGYSPGELVGQLIEILIPDDARGKHPVYRGEYLTNPQSRRLAGRDLLARKKDGETFPVEVRLNPIDTTDGIVILSSIIDLTERKKFENTILGQAKELEDANKLLSEQATTDSLTNLANRRSWSSQLETLLLLANRNGRPISILMTDIDDFKKYNDAYGHPAGDTVLETVAQALIDETRDSDFVARYGGEEFSILLPETEHDKALMVAEKIQKKIAAISSLQRKITMSIGVATLEMEPHAPFDATQTGDKLIGDADKALYYSKEKGKNTITHFSSMR